jgi:hypothetical protein
LSKQLNNKSAMNGKNKINKMGASTQAGEQVSMVKPGKSQKFTSQNNWANK